VAFADIDKANGKLATPMCPVVFHEAFLPGTEPKEFCEIHGAAPAAALHGFFSKLGKLFGVGK
jgi:hypothetical protein